MGLQLLLALAAAAAAPCAAKLSWGDDAPPSFVSTSGEVSGEWVSVDGEGEAARFLGIPYAAAPVGDLRWAAPAPPAPWSAPLSATAWPPGCAQTHPATTSPDTPVDQSEDCLRLNVYLPKAGLEPGASLPVLFFLHGCAAPAQTLRAHPLTPPPQRILRGRQRPRPVRRL